MKKLRLLLILAVLAAAWANAAAQNLYSPAREGMILEYVSTDADGKVDGYSTKRVESIEATAGGSKTTVVTRMLNADRERDENMPEVSETLIVDGHNAIQPKEDIGSMMNAMIEEIIKSQPETTANVDMVVEGDDIVYPLEPLTGQTIPPSTIIISMKYDNGGKVRSMKLMTMVFGQRTVAGRESVTTEAGTFDCVKISGTMKMKVMLMSETEYSTTWYAMGVGEVMSRVTTKKGRIISESKLISITN